MIFTFPLFLTPGKWPTRLKNGSIKKRTARPMGRFSNRGLGEFGSKPWGNSVQGVASTNLWLKTVQSCVIKWAAMTRDHLNSEAVSLQA